MAIIVKHLPTENEYIFLGIEPGAMKPSFSPKILGELFTHETEGKAGRVAVCDPQGQILWFDASELAVIEVDGQVPSEMLPEILVTNIEEETPSESEDFKEDDEEEWV